MKRAHRLTRRGFLRGSAATAGAVAFPTIIPSGLLGQDAFRREWQAKIESFVESPARRFGGAAYMSSRAAFNDRASSIKFEGLYGDHDYLVLLYEHIDFDYGGRQVEIGVDTPDLSVHDFNDEASSLQIRGIVDTVGP